MRYNEAQGVTAKLKEHTLHVLGLDKDAIKHMERRAFIAADKGIDERSAALTEAILRAEKPVKARLRKVALLPVCTCEHQGPHQGVLFMVFCTARVGASGHPSESVRKDNPLDRHEAEGGITASQTERHANVQSSLLTAVYTAGIVLQRCATQQAVRMRAQPQRSHTSSLH